MSITVNELMTKSDAEYLMAPLLALHTASQEEKVLLDDLMRDKLFASNQSIMIEEKLKN